MLHLCSELGLKLQAIMDYITTVQHLLFVQIIVTLLMPFVSDLTVYNLDYFCIFGSKECNWVPVYVLLCTVLLTTIAKNFSRDILTCHGKRLFLVADKLSTTWTDFKEQVRKYSVLKKMIFNTISIINRSNSNIHGLIKRKADKILFLQYDPVTVFVKDSNLSSLFKCLLFHCPCKCLRYVSSIFMAKLNTAVY